MSALSRIRAAFGTLITPGQGKFARILAGLLDEKVGLPWKVKEITGDLYPGDGVDPGIGTLDDPVNHLAVGHRSPSGMEGLLAERNALEGGGLMVLGQRDTDPDAPVVPPVQGNAIVELNGNAILVATGGLWLQVQSPLLVDHEILVGPSTQIGSSRHFAPVIVGPEKVYEHFESAENPNDLNIRDTGETEIVSMTLTNDYTAYVSSFSFQIHLDNPGKKQTDFDVILKANAVEAARYTRSFTENGGLVSDAITLQLPRVIGDVISLDVDATPTHGQAQAWVRGTIQPTSIQISQG